jgi:hypothetical protein
MVRGGMEGFNGENDIGNLAHASVCRRTCRMVLTVYDRMMMNIRYRIAKLRPPLRPRSFRFLNLFFVRFEIGGMF